MDRKEKGNFDWSSNGYTGVVSEWYNHCNSEGQLRCGRFWPICILSCRSSPHIQPA